MNELRYFADSVLYSYAQIFFSNRRWFGTLVLAASFFVPGIGFMALAGVVLANLFAHLLKFDAEKIRTGFYGFNGLLFGAASMYYFQPSYYLLVIIPVFILLVFLISAVVEHYFASAFNLPGLSLPFIITLFVFFYFLSNGQGINTAQHTDVTGSWLPLPLKMYLHAISIIILQPGVYPGLLIAAGLLLFSRVLFLLSLFSAILAFYAAGLFLPDVSDYTLLLITFNAILTAMALGGSLIIPSRKSFSLAMVTVLLTIILTGFFVQFLKTSNLPILVLPFNFITLATIYGLKFRKEHSDLTLLYFAPGAPEENFYYHKNRITRFSNYKPLFAELPIYGEWLVSQGFNGRLTHKEEWKYAWDFIVVDEKNEQYQEAGNNLSDYYCYKLPVVAPLDAEVVKVIDGIPNNKIGDVDIQKNWGNTIVLHHGEGLYSALSHLEPGSIKVKEGEKVSKGSIIAQCGNSGRSPYPHIHFQFQLTDELGAHTYQFPLAHYIEKLDNKLALQTFSFPKQDTIVLNLETHRTLKSAFEFKYESTYQWKCTTEKKAFTENWEVKVNAYNILYIESDNHAKVTLYLTPKVVYLTDFSGNKKSALYYLYLLAPMIPLGYHAELTWKDSFSPALFNTGPVRYFAELFMLLIKPLEVEGTYRFASGDEDGLDFTITALLQLKGRFPFQFVHRQDSGRLAISRDGCISSFQYNEKSIEVFKAELITERQ